VAWNSHRPLRFPKANLNIYSSPQPLSFPRAPQGTSAGPPLCQPERHVLPAQHRALPGSGARRRGCRGALGAWEEPQREGAAGRGWSRASGGRSREAGAKMPFACPIRCTLFPRKIPCRSCIAMVPCALLIEKCGGSYQLRSLEESMSCGLDIVAIDPRHTSQTCSHCGCKHRANRCSQALFQCRHCGYTLHADLNATKDMAAKYRVSHGISSTGAPLSSGVSSPLPRNERDKRPPLGDGC